MAKGKQQGKKRKNQRKRSNERTAGEPPRVTGKAIRRLERRMDELTREQKALRKRLKKLTRRIDAAARPPFPPGPPFGGGRRSRPRGGGPPWAKGLGPVVTLEVPLETDDPTAPLWATVSARLPEEITAVGDDGRVVRYRYSAVGSTPQAPRYRPLAGPDPASPEPSPG